MTYHYWINNKEGKILPLYELNEKGKEIYRKKCIYTPIDSRTTNRSISLVENKIVSEMDILEKFNLVEISPKCRFIFNDKITLLEMDGRNIELVFELFFSLTEDDVIFFIDDKRIQ